MMKLNFFVLPLFFLLVYPPLLRGQHEGLTTLKAQFQRAAEVTPERLYAHLDRPGYFVGETVWFRLYCVDGIDHRPSEVSMVAYVELLNKDNQAVRQAKVALTGGAGSGFFELPTSLESGNYSFRAYTNWMQNFNVGDFFHSTITVVNPFLALSPPPDSLKAANEIQFFPEGGSLVHGLRSKVAFSAVDARGNGLDLDGAIVDGSGDTVASFSSLRYGIGSFYITPKKAQNYQALLKTSDGTILRKLLPAPVNEGYVMHVADSMEKISVSIASSAELINERVYLVVHNNNGVIDASTGTLGDNHVDFTFNKPVDSGIVTITLFDRNLVPMAERLYCKVGQSELHISGQINQSAYHPRQKVILQLHTSAPKSGTLDADMSISIYRLDSIHNGEHDDIARYLNYTGGLRGRIEHASFYFDSAPHPGKAVAIDNLMLTHGWRRFRWQENILKKDFPFIPEVNGHLIRGRLVVAESKDPAANVTVYVSRPGHEAEFSIARTDEKGTFFFRTNRPFGEQEIVIQTNSRDHDASLSSPFSTLYSNAPAPIILNPSLAGAIASRSIYMQVQKVFAPVITAEPANAHAGVSPFYGNGDKTYRLDDYVRFPTMEEILRENVPEVMVRKKTEGFHLMVQNALIDKKAFFSGQPLILLDGVPVFDVSLIMDVDPKKIRQLEVVTSKYFYGGLTFDGIISLSSYTGDLAGMESFFEGVIKAYSGLQGTKEFFSPGYETKGTQEKSLPDARTLLLWKPNVRTDATGNATVEFYTSDISGTYRINVQGLSSSGECGSLSMEFNTKKDGP